MQPGPGDTAARHRSPVARPLLAVLLAGGLVLGACSDDQSGSTEDITDPALTGDEPITPDEQPAPGDDLELPGEAGEAETQ